MMKPLRKSQSQKSKVTDDDIENSYGTYRTYKICLALINENTNRFVAIN